jgi:hypothetical protein
MDPGAPLRYGRDDAFRYSVNPGACGRPCRITYGSGASPPPSPLP